MKLELLFVRKALRLSSSLSNANAHDLRIIRKSVFSQPIENLEISSK